MMGHDDQETAVGGPVDELWLRLCTGGETGWDELYRDHADELRRYFAAKLPDQHEVGDCVHEVFLRAVATATKPDAKPVASMGGWLQGIARNVLKARYEDADKRRERFDPQPVEDTLLQRTHAHQGETDHADPFDNDGKRQALADAWEVIETLPPSRRTLLITFLTVSGRQGREVKGAELAAEMGEGWPRARVDRELSRARADVRRGMGVLAVARKASGCVDAAALVGKVHPQLRFADLSDTVWTALATHANSPTATMVGVDRARESTPKAGCKTCPMIFRDAQRPGLYALGPGLLLLAAYTEPDDDRAASGVVGPVV